MEWKTAMHSGVMKLNCVPTNTLHSVTSLCSNWKTTSINSRKWTRTKRASSVLGCMKWHLLSWFYISCKLIASLLRQSIWSLHFEINASYWLSQQTCDRLATNIEPALDAFSCWLSTHIFSIKINAHKTLAARKLSY